MKILFVCAGNIFRSPIAEQAFRDAFGEAYEVASAGLLNKNAERNIREIIGEPVITLLEKRGVKIPDHKCHPLTKEDMYGSDYVFVMEHWMRSMILERYSDFGDKVFVLQDFAGYKGNLEIWDPVTASLSENVKTCQKIKRTINRIKRLRLLEQGQTE